MPPSETFEEAFRSLTEAAYHGKLKPGSMQYSELRKFFYAGTLWFVEQCTARNSIDSVLKELEAFYKDLSVKADMAKSIKRDIERSGQ